MNLHLCSFEAIRDGIFFMQYLDGVVLKLHPVQIHRFFSELIMHFSFFVVNYYFVVNYCVNFNLVFPTNDFKFHY